MPMTETGTEAQTQRDIEQQQFMKTAALKALTNIYGAQAADPEVWGQAATAAAQAPLAPQAAQAQLSEAQSKAAEQQASAQRTQNQANQGNLFTLGKLLSQNAAADGSLDLTALDNPYVQKFAGLTPEQAAQAKQFLAGPGGKDRLDNMLSAGIGPIGAMAAGGVAYGTDPNTGASVMIRSTKAGAPIVTPLPGNVQPTAVEQAATARANEQSNAATRTARVGIAQQNANTAAYSAGTRANNTQFGAPAGVALGRGTAPAGTAAPVDQAATTDLIHGGSQSAPVSAPGSVKINSLPPKGRQMAIGQATQLANMGTTLDTTNKIIDTVDKQIGTFTAGGGSLLAHLPGTEQKNLQANLETLRAQGLMTWIGSLKNANGQTGIGRILQTEANTAMQLYGNMEQDQTASQLRYHLGLFKQTVNRIYDTARRGFGAMYGTSPESALGMPERGGAKYSPAQQAALKKYGL